MESADQVKMNYAQLSTGRFMPSVALGCGYLQTSDPIQLTAIINRALELGYKHFDTAYLYRNEHILGAVFKKWMDAGKLKREELFVTSKLPPQGDHPEFVNHFLKASLAALQLEYVDMYLIHTPVGFEYGEDNFCYSRTSKKGLPENLVLDMNTDLEAIWKEMEIQQELGLTKAIGVSNFSTRQLKRIIEVAKNCPANIQTELHAYFQRPALRQLCRQHGIVVSAYGTLGSLGREKLMEGRGRKFLAPALLRDPCVTSLATKYGKTPAQILVRHLIQLEVTPVVGTRNLDRLLENVEVLTTGTRSLLKPGKRILKGNALGHGRVQVEVFDFKLDESDMDKMNDLDKGDAGRCFNSMNFHPEVMSHPEYPYNEP